MPLTYKVPRWILEETFAYFRTCGSGRRECQVLWVSPWDTPEIIRGALHPKHQAHAGGFMLDNAWVNCCWVELAQANSGIRVQVHTHPRDAFHSTIDDDFPVIHTAGFLSLVIPRFGMAAIGLEDAYLTEIQEDGTWMQLPPRERLTLV